MKKITIFIFLLIAFISCNEESKDNLIETNCSFIYPTNNSVLNNNTEINLSVSTSENVKKVEFYLDGQLIGSAISTPFTFKWTPENIDGGNHDLICIAIPQEGKEIQCEIDVIFELRLGDKFKGGKIFFLDETGQHGLIAAESDLSFDGDNTFFYGPQELIGANNTDYGKDNTKKMSDASENPYYAGYAFKNNYEFNGYSDWYIPAKEELKLLKENKGYVGGFSNESNSASYWSSTELTSDKAYALNFVALMGTEVSKGLYSYRVRPIREF
jgi:hypothetical protein